jgi:hypothetical protein
MVTNVDVVSFRPGPPGTGKTHVGLQIVRVILANTRHSDTDDENNAAVDAETVDEHPAAAAAKKPVIGPVICLCYTNHALDQVRSTRGGIPKDEGRSISVFNGFMVSLQYVWH